MTIVSFRWYKPGWGNVFVGFAGRELYIFIYMRSPQLALTVSKIGLS